LDALNKEECSPLMVSCTEGKSDVVKYLLLVGTNMCLRSHEGMTCLHLAAKNGHLETVHAVLSHTRLPKKLINETVMK
jgi:ankyrin repeat protein